MTIHSLIQYLQYRWKAKNRHGVHSPFAYAFVEDVIENKKNIKPADIVIPWGEKPGMNYDGLVRRMMAYYGYKTIMRLPGSPALGAYDVLILNDGPEKWIELIGANKHLILNNSAVILTGIHSTSAHTAAWQNVCANDIVRMGIDLYGIGVLFFKEEFKVKQHFVMKGPAS